jgi:hypothetical protein
LVNCFFANSIGVKVSFCFNVIFLTTLIPKGGQAKTSKAMEKKSLSDRFKRFLKRHKKNTINIADRYTTTIKAARLNMVPYINKIGGKIIINVNHKITDNILNIINELRNLFKVFSCILSGLFSVVGQENKKTDWNGIKIFAR